MYLNGDIRLCCAGNRLEFVGRKMESIIEDDDQFGNWASEKNLITAAENWGDNLKRFEKESRRIYRFFHVLELLLESDCQQDWSALSGELKEMLFKSEVCYDYKTDEVLCVLHALPLDLLTMQRYSILCALPNFGHRFGVIFSTNLTN